MEAMMRAPTGPLSSSVSRLSQEDEESLVEAPPYAGEEDEEDPDVADANNPDVQSFGEAPLLGGRRLSGDTSSDVFDGSTENFGRVTSPKLYAQAAQFPTVVQYRIWRWENGIPSALGAIDAEANEDRADEEEDQGDQEPDGLLGALDLAVLGTEDRGQEALDEVGHHG
jgi:hypothetical protein